MTSLSNLMGYMEEVRKKKTTGGGRYKQGLYVYLYRPWIQMLKVIRKNGTLEFTPVRLLLLIKVCKLSGKMLT